MLGTPLPARTPINLQGRLDDIKASLKVKSTIFDQGK